MEQRIRDYTRQIEVRVVGDGALVINAARPLPSSRHAGTGPACFDVTVGPCTASDSGGLGGKHVLRGLRFWLSAQDLERHLEQAHDPATSLSSATAGTSEPAGLVPRSVGSKRTGYCPLGER